MKIDESYFSDNYLEARACFRAAAQRCGFVLEAHSIGARGPGGEQLSIDVACGGDLAAERAVVISSGLHGVEAPFGSAVQLAALQNGLLDGLDQSAPRIVLIHVLNPYGYSWGRRVDEDNVDPNRNFLLADEVYAGSPPAYKKLDWLLSPPQTPVHFAPFAIRVGWSALRHGVPALRQAIMGGQYDHPTGLFYGGRGPSRTQHILTEHLPRWLEGVTIATHLDFHTGLGRWGSCELLVDQRIDAAEARHLERCFGPGRLRIGRDLPYQARGSLGAWCQQRLASCRYSYVCAEFGTYRQLTLLAGLCAENQSHHASRPDKGRKLHATRRLQELFCPKSRSWRRQVARRGVRLVAQAIYQQATARV